MIVFRKKIILKNIIFIGVFFFWFLFTLRLSVTNIQLLYKNYVLFHDKTSTEKLHIVLKEDYLIFEYILNNTSSDATVLLISDTKNVFFDYYLYPKKIIWSNTPVDQISDDYLESNQIDMVIFYDANHNIIQHTIQQ